MNPAIHPAITSFEGNTQNRSRLTRSVFLPKEHGSWSLALEPVAFGLLIVPSLAGGSLAVSATAAFFIRRPLKSLLKAHDRTTLLSLSILSTFALIGFAQVVMLGVNVTMRRIRHPNLDINSEGLHIFPLHGDIS